MRCSILIPEYWRELLQIHYPGHRKVFALASFFVFVALTGLIPIFIQKQIFDRVIPSGSMSLLLFLAFALITAHISTLLLGIIQDFIIARFSEKLLANLRNKFARGLLAKSSLEASQLNSGEVLRAHDDAMIIAETLKSSYFETIKNIFILAIYIPALLCVNWQLTLLKIVPFPILYAISRRFAQIDRAYEQEIWQLNARAANKLAESLRGLSILKTFSGEQIMLRKLKRLFLLIQKNAVLRKLVQYLWHITGSQLQHFISVSILILAVFHIIQGNLSFGDFIIFSIMSETALQAFASLTAIQKSLLQNRNSLFRYQAIALSNNLPCTAAHNHDKLTGDIGVHNLHFSYHNKVILHDINLNIKKGSYTLITGQSGSGKSTFAHLIAGNLPPSNGELTLNHIPYSEIPAGRFRQSICMVAQDDFMFSTTLKDNILPNGLCVNHRELYATLRNVNALEIIAALPQRLYSEFGKEGLNLSGGQKQRLALARALLHKPSTLILDEATSALDHTNEEQIISLIEQLRGNMTIIHVTHKLANAHRADNIIHIEQGKCVEQGSHEELINLKGKYYELFNTTN